MGARLMDRIFVTWTQQWSIDDYVENYSDLERSPPATLIAA